MKKKRMIAGAMGIVMMGAMALPAGAADTEPNNLMTVTYREPNAYTITIPAKVMLSSTTGSHTEIKATGVNLEPGKKIQISISQGVDENGVVELSRENDTETKAVTTVSTTDSGAGIGLDKSFAEFQADGSQELYFTALTAKDGGEIKAGDYSGQLTFTVEAPGKN